MEQETRQTIQVPEILAFLPHEFHLPLFLSHIKRSIDNMNMRLKAAEPILERYFTKRSSARESWKEKLSRFLDTNPQQTSTAITTSSVGKESGKLGIRAKLRWISGDMKELTYLVETIRTYNAELMELLPSSQVPSFERRIGRVLVTSRYLTKEAASNRLENQELLDSRELKQVDYYRSLARLIESRCVDTLQHRSFEGLNNIEKNAELHSERVIQTSSPLHTCLHLRISDFKFANFEGRVQCSREFASHGATPVIIEWRHYSTTTSHEMLSYLDARVHMLALQLQQLSSLGEKGILCCRGHFHDEKNYRHGIVFEYPRDRQTTTPVTLQDRLKDDHERRVRRDLNERFRLAHTLITTVYRLFSVNWLHKNLSSDSILLFEDDPDVHSIQSPFICGFVFARRDAKLELSENLATVYQDTYAAINERLYWHPDRQLSPRPQEDSGISLANNAGLPRSGYRREFDCYSLGILLLEIGLWCPVRRILKDCKTDDLAAFAAKVKETYVPELRGRMGKVYTDIVSSCLEGNFGTGYTGENDGEDVEQRRMRSFLEDFEKLVVSPIDRPFEV